MEKIIKNKVKKKQSKSTNSIEKEIATYVKNFFKKRQKTSTFIKKWIRKNISIMLSEISQSEKDKYHMISLICGI